ncbi:MAG: DUF202 domain-containing protein [Rubripirellula sp.]
MNKNAPNAQQVLAMMRTDLANERTLLAYGRTALMFTATGVTLLKFFPLSDGLHVTGWALGGIGIIIGIWESSDSQQCSSGFDDSMSRHLKLESTRPKGSFDQAGKP